MTLLDDRVDEWTDEWVDVCPLDDLVDDRGVCALIDGHPVAVFRCRPDGELFALSNIDPFSLESVLSRGIVGSIGDRPVVASPLYKNRFDLRSGESLDDPTVAVDRYAIRCVESRIQVKRVGQNV